MTEILTPKLSDSREEGTVSAWLKRDDEMVAEEPHQQHDRLSPRALAG